MQFSPCTVEDPDICDECGGQGEIVYGDGGTGRRDDAFTDTGGVITCNVCDGTGEGGLVAVAREKLGLTPPRN